MPHRSLHPSQLTQPTDGQVVIESIGHFRSHQLKNSRTVHVLLPPGYQPNHSQPYPVLYLNDGQDIAALRLRATLEALYASGQLKPLVVVAIHTSADRLREYGVAGVPNAQGLGNRARRYTSFLIDELMPVLQRRYLLATEPAQVAIAGASLGGLSAFDIAWCQPELFGAVGVFSGSFWWRSDDSSVAARQQSRIMHRRVRETPGRPDLRFWLQAGTADETADRDGDGIIDAIQDTTELIDALVARGYPRGPDLIYREVVGGQHNQETWALVMPEFLTWAFGVPQSASARVMLAAEATESAE